MLCCRLKLFSLIFTGNATTIKGDVESQPCLGLYSKHCWQISERHHDTQYNETYIRLIATLSINNQQFIKTLNVPLCLVPLCWVSLSWVPLLWAPLCRVTLCWVTLCWVSLYLVSLLICWMLYAECHFVECHCVECCDRQNRLEILIIIKRSSLLCHCQHQNYAPKEFCSKGNKNVGFLHLTPFMSTIFYSHPLTK